MQLRLLSNIVFITRSDTQARFFYSFVNAVAGE